MYKRYKNQLLNEINTLNSDQNGYFWKLMNQIRKLETIDDSSDIPPEDWIMHFQNLLYDAEETRETREKLESHTQLSIPQTILTKLLSQMKL